MPTDAAIIDFDHAEQRKMFNGWVKSLHGPHRVSIKKCRAVRSLNANAFYWGVILPAVANGLEECWGERMETEEVHEWLKAKFNAKTVVNHHTGEVLDHRPCSTATLDVKEFSTYLDKVIKFAGEQLHVEVPTPT